MDLWDPGSASSSNPAYTTITTWHNKGKDIEYQGETYYWTKDREFMKVIDLPARSPAPLELALGVNEEVARMLTEHGWRQVNSVDISRDFDRYRKYIQGSRGEFTVARDQYVRPNTGWFSDRSACYLAAGRPVITQETGFSKYLPTGNGLFGFNTIEDILAAIEAIETDHAAHCRAAREIANVAWQLLNVIGPQTSGLSRRNASASAAYPPAQPPNAPTSQLRAVWALLMVSCVVKVFEATMNRVSSARKSRVASAKSVASTLETKRKVRARSA